MAKKVSGPIHYRGTAPLGTEIVEQQQDEKTAYYVHVNSKRQTMIDVCLEELRAARAPQF